MTGQQIIRVILNGKCANETAVRDAIFKARERFSDYKLEVRVTWEQGDIERLYKDACNDKITRVVVGGGDGTLNEFTHAALSSHLETAPELGILPLGTANDFASACGIPKSIEAALKLAITGQAQHVDVGKCNQRYFINVAAGGFGAQITNETPSELKNFLGGSAYTLTGLVRALNFSPYKSRFVSDSFDTKAEVIIAAICNGRQAGGGQQLAPNARVNDGLFDVIFISAFQISDGGQVIKELFNPDASGTFVQRFRTKKLLCEFETHQAAPLNLDGEPLNSNRFEFEIIPKALPVVIPSNCPMLHG
ncbi:lipid kinase YegS [Alteromonadaceae bacterium 2753L.S.0a.02]|nr:lipid kinase YegS [Alteromonadaceae bacterium 2753L.S.0a.02]